MSEAPPNLLERHRLGLPLALSVIVSMPVCTLAKPGAKISEITQDWPGGKYPRTGLLVEPLRGRNLLNHNITEPLGLVTVTISWLLLAPITVFGKVRFDGVILSE